MKKASRPFQVDLTGRTFGSLLVTGFAGRRGGKAIWACNCSCGNSTEVVGNYLTTGNVNSCGCLRYRPISEQRAVQAPVRMRPRFEYEGDEQSLIDAQEAQQQTESGHE